MSRNCLCKPRVVGHRGRRLTRQTFALHEAIFPFFCKTSDRGTTGQWDCNDEETRGFQVSRCHVRRWCGSWRRYGRYGIRGRPSAPNTATEMGVCLGLGRGSTDAENKIASYLLPCGSGGGDGDGGVTLQTLMPHALHARHTHAHVYQRARILSSPIVANIQGHAVTATRYVGWTRGNLLGLS